MTRGNFESRAAINPEAATPADIYSQLHRIAMINSDFRSGLSGTFSLSVEQSEPLLLRESAGPDSNWPDPLISEQFEFDAKRLEMSNGSTEFWFTYGYSSIYQNMRLPHAIAAYAFGGEVDPVTAAGPTRMVRSFHAEINSNTFELNVLDAVKYFDNDGDVVVDVDSDSYPQEASGQTVFPMIPKDDTDSEDEDEEDEAGEMRDGTPHVAHNVPHRFRNDAVLLVDRHEGAPTLEDLESFIDDYDPELREIIAAYNVLTSMKKAFRRQLGMQV